MVVRKTPLKRFEVFPQERKSVILTVLRGYECEDLDTFVEQSPGFALASGQQTQICSFTKPGSRRNQLRKSGGPRMIEQSH